MEFLYLAHQFQIYIPILPMPSIVISDTSSLILFDKIGELELLNKVYDSIVTTPEIASEFGDNLPDWIHIKKVKDY